jgi:hypothetical protein
MGGKGVPCSRNVRFATRGEVRVVAGSSALLRPSSAPLVRLAVLSLVGLAVAPPLANAASHAPDPSPHYGLVAPDPYPTSHAPRTTPVRITTVPVYVQRLPVTVQSPEAQAKPKRTVPVVRQRPQKAVVRSSQPVEPVRNPDHAAPQIVALGQTALVESPQHASRRLVLALGVLVLLSASLVAGAARELAR